MREVGGFLKERSAESSSNAELEFGPWEIDQVFGSDFPNGPWHNAANGSVTTVTLICSYPDVGAIAAGSRFYKVQLQ
jgi:hypothetical protein